MNWKFNKSSTRGEVAELTFEILCHQLGLEAARSLNKIAPYDYLLNLNGKWLKIQVKTAYKTPTYESLPSRKYKMASHLVLRLFRHSQGYQIRDGDKVQERRYREGDFDYIFATTGSEHWLIPFEVVVGKWNINLSCGKYKQYKFP